MLNVSRNGYYKFLRSPLSKREGENESLLAKIKLFHAKSRETYGSPRVHAALQLEGETCSKKRVAQLMKKAGIEAKMKKRFKITTKVNPAFFTSAIALDKAFSRDSSSLQKSK